MAVLGKLNGTEYSLFMVQLQDGPGGAMVIMDAALQILFYPG
jgi:hypothetical protein